MIKPLTKDDILSLSVHDLASRMDSLVLESLSERYGLHHHPQPLVSEILLTPHVQKMNESKQREVCYLTFNTLLQMHYTDFAGVISNKFIFGDKYNKCKSWGSPTIQIRTAAINQFTVISSRISMECFMQLLHFLGTGERIKAKKSTFKSFKKWINDAKNPFSYFATHIFRAFVFDRNHRTPEVHAATRLSSKVLMMGKPAFVDLNSYSELENLMLNIWQPLVDILNDGKCYSMYGNEEDFQWLKSYLNDTKEEKGSALELIFEQMK